MFLEDKQHTFWAPLQLTWTPLTPCLNDIPHIHIQQWITHMCGSGACQEVNVLPKYTIEQSVLSAWALLGQFIQPFPLRAHPPTRGPSKETKAFRHFGTFQFLGNVKL